MKTEVETPDFRRLEGVSVRDIIVKLTGQGIGEERPCTSQMEIREI
jgi:hypothetical protein